MTRHSSTLAMPRGRTKPIRTAITRSGSMMSETRTDHYGYNDRSELVSGTKDTAATNLTEYAYQYDDIGNRLSSLDLGTNRTYTANALNQYTNIVEGAGGFLPQFDDDGNQTLIKTTTGIWQVSYNAENRPVLWECGSTNITMKFDRMGRRVEYVEMVNGVTNTHHRFVYDGYVCIQRLNGAANNSIDLVFGWDPSEPVATRPLVLQKYGQYNLFYTHDGNKNVSELVFFQQTNGIAAHYEYAPFGAVTATSRSTPVTAYDFREYNPFRFSSEYADDVIVLVYYNYRHYNIVIGRWINRDYIDEDDEHFNLYLFCLNRVDSGFDYLGLKRKASRRRVGPYRNTCAEKKKRFMWWYEAEKEELKKKDDNGQNWVERLPKCPGSLVCDSATGEFKSPDQEEWLISKWFSLTQKIGNYHPGGVYEMRTRNPSKYGGHGNQCVYDGCGNLMTNIPSAGTVDYSSPESSFWGHQFNDVKPYDLAKDIDQNCKGNGRFVKLYYDVRPSW